jgi:hypothetical protein
MSRDRYGIKFNPTTVRRIAEVTRYTEQQPRSQAPQLAGPVDFGGSTMLLVTTALNPMSGPTPGQNGRGKIQTLIGTSYADFSSTVFPIVNDSTETVAVGSYVLCVPGPGGMFHMVVVDKCSNLS